MIHQEWIPGHLSDRTSSSDLKVLLMVIIAGSAGILGACAILFFEEGLGGWLAYPPFYAIPSMITWSILYRFVVNHSVQRAFVVGLASSLVACIMFSPLLALGFLWAIGLIRYWWITVPVGVGTSLLIQLLASDYRAGYSPWPRVVALAGLLVAVALSAAPVVAHNLRDPLRADREAIRARLLRATPVGSTSDDVLRALGSTIDYDRNGTRRYFFEAPKYFADRPADRYEDTPGVAYAYPVGKGSVQILLGQHRTFRQGQINVWAAWAFDGNARLIEVLVRKTQVYPRYTERIKEAGETIR